MLGVGIFGAAWREDGYKHLPRVAVLGFAFVGVFALFALGFRCSRCGLDVDGPPPGR